MVRELLYERNGRITCTNRNLFEGTGLGTKSLEIYTGKKSDNKKVGVQNFLEILHW